MAKRFTDSDKWKKAFFRQLPAAYKLFFLYLIDDCDHAGIWEVDIEVAEVKIGEKIDKKKALDFFGEAIKEIDSGKKWFLTNFIFFQYGNLTKKNTMHKPVYNKLKIFGLEGCINGGSIPHLSPIDGVKVKERVKEEVMDKVKVMDINKPESTLKDSKKENIAEKTFSASTPDLDSVGIKKEIPLVKTYDVDLKQAFKHSAKNGKKRKVAPKEKKDTEVHLACKAAWLAGLKAISGDPDFDPQWDGKAAKGLDTLLKMLGNQPGNDTNEIIISKFSQYLNTAYRNDKWVRKNQFNLNTLAGESKFNKFYPMINQKTSTGAASFDLSQYEKA